MIIVTTPDIAGSRITDVLGLLEARGQRHHGHAPQSHRR
jgi:uncharacterized protein YbjQ (UPF0145 family)